MQHSISDKIHRINYLTSELEGLYHITSVKMNISDSVSRVLYTIYDTGDSCLLSDIYKQSGVSKQTVNSAIRNLEKQGILYLEPYQGRAKRVCLTDAGKDYVKQTAARIYEAETKAISSWTEEEIETHIRLMEKFLESFREQVETW